MPHGVKYHTNDRYHVIYVNRDILMIVQMQMQQSD